MRTVPPTVPRTPSTPAELRRTQRNQLRPKYLSKPRPEGLQSRLHRFDSGRRLSGFLDLDERGWFALVRRAERTAESEPFRRIVSIIASALERIDVLSGDEIRFLVGPEVCRANGIEPVEEVPAWSA